LEKLSFIKDKWVWLGGYDSRHLPKGAGFKWDVDKKIWWTANPTAAKKLAPYIVAEDQKILESQIEALREAYQSSWASDASINIPKPNGLDYRGYQKAGIKYMLDRKGTLLGDEMGTGKTIQAIGFINYLPEIKKILIISPKTPKINWERELKKWLVRPYSISIIDSKSIIDDSDILILNYETVVKYRDILANMKWDLLIVDEAHYLKNGEAKRTQAILGREAHPKKQITSQEPIKATYRLFLTGSPLLNKPIELWTLAHSLNPDTFNNYWNFVMRYCDGKKTDFGWNFAGSSNLRELQSKLRSTIMIRRLKRDVLPELPDKIRQVIELEPNKESQRAVEEESKVGSKFEDLLIKLRAEIEIAKATEDLDLYKESIKKLQYTQMLSFKEISKERHRVSLSKVPEVIEHLESALEEHKVICFAYHLDVIDQIYKSFETVAVRLTGEISGNEARQKIIDKFQNDPSCKLFIGQFNVAGQSITLTSASHVVFAELDWVPANVTQAEDRAHRYGQKDSVLVQHLVVDGSLDAKMAKAMVEKQAIADEALDILIDVAPDEITPYDAGMVRVTKDLKTMPDLSPTQIKGVVKALKHLASLCDGAKSIDSLGFNKVDAQIGRSLSLLPSLSLKQAKLGYKITKKYHRQLPEDIIKELN
jgi:SNF2 family DNA or RNA helicase